MFWTEIWKISEFLIWKFSDFGGEIFYMYLNRRVFVMDLRVWHCRCAFQYQAFKQGVHCVKYSLYSNLSLIETSQYLLRSNSDWFVYQLIMGLLIVLLTSSEKRCCFCFLLLLFFLFFFVFFFFFCFVLFCLAFYFKWKHFVLVDQILSETIVFSFSVFCSQILNLKLNLRPKFISSIQFQ